VQNQWTFWRRKDFKTVLYWNAYEIKHLDEESLSSSSLKSSLSCCQKFCFLHPLLPKRSQLLSPHFWQQGWMKLSWPSSFREVHLLLAPLESLIALPFNHKRDASQWDLLIHQWSDRFLLWLVKYSFQNLILDSLPFRFLYQEFLKFHQWALHFHLSWFLLSIVKRQGCYHTENIHLKWKFRTSQSTINVQLACFEVRSRNQSFEQSHLNCIAEHFGQHWFRFQEWLDIQKPFFLVLLELQTLCWNVLFSFLLLMQDDWKNRQLKALGLFLFHHELWFLLVSQNYHLCWTFHRSVWLQALWIFRWARWIDEWKALWSWLLQWTSHHLLWK